MKPAPEVAARRHSRRLSALVVSTACVAWGAAACASTSTNGPAEGGAPDATGRSDAGDAGAPLLENLSVTSAVAGPMVPAFSPGTFDYYVRCPSGASDWTVTMTAAKDAESALVQPSPSPLLDRQTVHVDLSGNQAVVAVAKAGSATTQYWVRCLPSDFPPIEMRRNSGADKVSPGYYLVGTSTPPSQKRGYAMILDRNGVPVWYASTPSGGVGDVDTLGHDVVAFFRSFKNDPIIVARLSGARTMTQYPAPSGDTLDTHEFQLLKNGNLLVISNPIVTADLTGVHVDFPDGGRHDFGVGSSMNACRVVEFVPKTGKPVWTWDAAEHFDPALDAIATTASVQAGVLVADPYHCNSIDIDPANENILVSARSMDALFYVERPSGKVIWKVGGNPFTKDGATYVSITDPFYQQHDGRLVAGWSSECGTGSVTLFDDHSMKKGPARGLELDVVTGAPQAKDGGAVRDCGTSSDGPARASVAWQYAGTANSYDRGSFRITADGSRVIGWGDSRDPSAPVFTEVDEAGHDLVDFYFNEKNDPSYRAIKVPLTTYDIAVLRQTAGTSY